MERVRRESEGFFSHVMQRLLPVWLRKERTHRTIRKLIDAGMGMHDKLGNDGSLHGWFALAGYRLGGLLEDEFA
ncbi:hypothetical protein GCM10008066_05130 [Oxalicibacterium faecigallinarum]|uniref:Uncharacterized protein n=1 Tax=Oxalicibacterium faecigallinarum TaxID=573741 RepID=A0A8J3F4F1_9BURK|nr:hypothetical protein GCM10008066_05130 [Oxalicibacterium faecigallinarum]